MTHDIADDFAHILYEVSDGVATITLNDPDKLNPILHGPGSMQDELIRAFELTDADDDVRCVIVTGAGRAFSSGGGGGRHETTAPGWYKFFRYVEGAHDGFMNLRKPIIGGINGLCYGLAMRMVCHFDMVVAADTASFCLIETRFGGTGVEPLPFLIGRQWANFLALSGEVITAQKAKEIGLVLEVFPLEQFREKVNDLARRVAAMPHVAAQMNRRVIQGSMQMMGWNNAIELAMALNAITGAVRHEAVSADGRNLSELRVTDTKTFREARDAAFKEPWLPQQ